MPKTLTIELPDNLEQNLGLSTNTADDSLKGIILDTLNALAELIKALQDAETSNRMQAAERLGDMRAELAIHALSQALHEDEMSVRYSAQEALQKIGTNEALNLLDAYLSTQSTIPTLDPAYAPLLSLIGTIELDVTDLGKNHDRYIAEELERELRSDE